VSAVDRDTGEGQDISIREFVREDDIKAIALANDQGQEPTEPEAEAEAEEKGLLGRLAKIAGIGGEKSAGEGDGVSEPHAMAERDEGAAEAALAAADAAAIVDPHAVAERDEDAAAAALSAYQVEDTQEIPVLSGEDLYDIAPRDGDGSPFGRSLTVGDSLDLGDAGLEALDPFGVAPREDAGAADQEVGQAIAHSTKVEPAAAAPAAEPEAPAAPAAPARKKRPARLRISYKRAATFVKEYKRNLKRGGTFIKTKKPLEIGRACILHLTIPGCDEPVEVHGSVVWSSRGAEDVEGQEQGLGIKYSTEAEGGFEALKEVLEHLEQEAAASS
jgi:type IV pilus assembly protein PilZ